MPQHGVPVARLRIGGAQAPDVEPDLEMPDALALPPPRGLVCDHDDPRRPSPTAAESRGRGLPECGAAGCSWAALAAERRGRGHVAHGTVPGQLEAVEALRAARRAALQVGQIVLGSLPGEGISRERGSPAARSAMTRSCAARIRASNDRSRYSRHTSTKCRRSVLAGGSPLHLVCALQEVGCGRWVDGVQRRRRPGATEGPAGSQPGRPRTARPSPPPVRFLRGPLPAPPCSV